MYYMSVFAFLFFLLVIVEEVRDILKVMTVFGLELEAWRYQGFQKYHLKACVRVDI
jgi:hypothetical protein